MSSPIRGPQERQPGPPIEKFGWVIAEGWQGEQPNVRQLVVEPSAKRADDRDPPRFACKAGEDRIWTRTFMVSPPLDLVDQEGSWRDERGDRRPPPGPPPGACP